MLLICIQKHPWLKTLGATGKPVLCRAENGSFSHHAVEQVTAGDAVLDPEEPVEDGRPSSVQRLRFLRRAFMKKLLTVESSRPSCWEMVICRSLVGRWFSLKMAIRVRRCRSVKTSRVRLGPWLRSSLDCSCSLRLQAEKETERIGQQIRPENLNLGLFINISNLSLLSNSVCFSADFYKRLLSLKII